MHAPVDRRARPATQSASRSGGRFMGKVEVKIPHCVWRDGRPRFQPGPRLRALGFVGRDLCEIPPRLAKARGLDPGWWSLDRVAKWIEGELAREIRAKEAAAAAEGTRRRMRGKLPTAPKKASVVTVADLIDHAERIGGVKPSTAAFYAAMAKTLREIDPVLWVTPATAVRKARIYQALDAIKAVKSIQVQLGVRALLARAWREATRIEWGGVIDDPTHGIELERPEGRLRAATPEEFLALLAAADRLGRHDVGDCLVLGLLTGQSQQDRLALAPTRIRIVDGTPGSRTGVITFLRGKTEKAGEIPIGEFVIARLEAAAERRKDWPAIPSRVIVDEKRRIPFTKATYGAQFRKVRDAAIAGDADAGIAPCPSLADFQERDLRDTVVTWANDAGATAQQVRAVTFHSGASVQQMMDSHYNAQSAAQAQPVVTMIEQRLLSANLNRTGQ